jgi:putative DNA primase/helicase
VRSVGRPRAWDPEVIDQAIPELPKAIPNTNGGRSTAEPPVELMPEALKVWRGEKPKAKHTGEIDRSGSLVKVGRILYDAGATRSALVAALAERDEALGWRKYTGRADADIRYHEIVDELERNGRNGRVDIDGNGRGTTQPAGGYNLTDLGNARRLVHRHGRNLRYCWLWRKWLVWDGKRWVKDDTGEVYRLAKETVSSIYQEAAAAPNDEARKELGKHATRSEAGARIKEMVDLARSDVPVMPDELDASPDLLNTESGTIDLRTGELREHRREDLITKVAPTTYRPDAAAPTWEAFLERVLPGEDLRAFVQRAVGYSATGDTSEQCMFINHGGGANGKSTFQEAIAAALGDYAMRAPTEMLLAKRSDGVPNDVARLKGARFVSASETEEGRRLAESRIKDLTGQDTITARFMKAEWFDFAPTHKLWLSTNHKPEIRGTDAAIWRRIRLVPWTVSIPPAEQDKKLPEKLRSELPGILAWIVQGCLEWRRKGLQAPEEVRQATGDYRSEMDVLAAFLEECCILRSDAMVSAKNLYIAYKEWCEANGEPVEKQRRFGMRLTERGLRRQKVGGVYRWYGIGLRHDRQGPSEDKGPADESASFAGNSSAQTSGPGPSGPENHMKTKKKGVREDNGEIGPDGPDGPDNAGEDPLSPDLEPGGSATPEQLRKIRKLVREGMAEGLAREEILGKGWVEP